MRERASAKGSHTSAAQGVECPDCREFVEVVGGIHGANFDAGRRHFYSSGGPIRDSRCGPRYSVSPQFFAGVFNACGRWLVDHLGDEDDPRAHLSDVSLPAWVPDLLAGVRFDQRVGRDAAGCVCARLLGVSPRTVYAELAR